MGAWCSCGPAPGMIPNKIAFCVTIFAALTTIAIIKTSDLIIIVTIFPAVFRIFAWIAHAIAVAVLRTIGRTVGECLACITNPIVIAWVRIP